LAHKDNQSMPIPIVNSIASWFLKKRFHQIELFLKYPHDVQNELLFSLLKTAKDTEVGKKYDFTSIKSYEDFNRCTIKLNGHIRFKERDASYFRICQPYQAGHKIPTKHIYMYSFALNPEEHQPSGTCNFSRLDNAHISFNSLNDEPKHKINVYALNYNVLRIMSGMGGLAYSN